jgi:cephalosporin hydroxylase
MGRIGRLFSDFRAILAKHAALKMLSPAARGMQFAETSFQPVSLPTESESNPLLEYFEANRQGPGIWKWVHYFEIYHRHLQRFRNTDVHVMEVGIYSGGSMPMWRQYFGERSRIYGVDIEAVCRAYEAERIHVLIGDQSDRDFWAKTRSSVPRIDILIDDGGHHPEHQIVTLEEMLPHLRPGGVYICEDLHGDPHRFVSFVAGMASRLNSGRLSPFEQQIASVHLYPFLAVVEKRSAELELASEKRGTQWQPFLDGR